MKLSQRLKQRKFATKEVAIDGGTVIMPLGVLRPQDPTKAVDAAKSLLGTPYEQAEQPFQQIIRDQPYQFMGWLARKRPAIIDQDGNFLGNLQLGDSFVTSFRMLPPCFAIQGVKVKEAV